MSEQRAKLLITWFFVLIGILWILFIMWCAIPAQECVYTIIISAPDESRNTTETVIRLKTAEQVGEVSSQIIKLAIKPPYEMTNEKH